MLISGTLAALIAASIAASAAGAIGSGIAADKNRAAMAEANQANIDIANATNEFNSAEAEKQRQWQTEMSNTEVQRRMADMQAAGINPILASGSFGGASTPGGSSASGVMANQKAETFDASGITNALQASGNIMMIGLMRNMINSTNATSAAAKASSSELDKVFNHISH